MNDPEINPRKVLEMLDQEIEKIAGSNNVKEMAQIFEGHFEGAFKLAQHMTFCGPKDIKGRLVDVLVHAETIGYLNRNQLHVYLLAIMAREMHNTDPSPAVLKILTNESNKASS
jgi:hypothetical protein